VFSISEIVVINFAGEPSSPTDIFLRFNPIYRYTFLDVSLIQFSHLGVVAFSPLLKNVNK